LGFAVRHTIETIKYMAIVASQVGLTINASKIIYTINRKKTDNAPKEIEIDITKCLNFETLRLLVTNTNRTYADIKKRIIDSNKYFHALSHLLKDSYINTASKSTFL